MSKKLVLLFFLLVGFLLGCKKDAGDGGNASIKGHVSVRDYNNDFSVLISEYDGFDRYVYIKYGGNGGGFDDRLKTDYEGNYIFENLYPGTYEIYVYSKDSTFTEPSGQTVVRKIVELKRRKESLEVEEIVIFE
jgi:hypothetical protein